jgi:flagellar assembly protein FliH
MVRIIKSAELPPTKSPSERRQETFVDISHDVQHRLEQAGTQAARILEDAGQQAACMRLQAEQQGWEQGQQRAEAAFQQRVRDEVQRQLAGALPALQQAVEAVRQARTDHLRQCEAGLIRLAGAIAARLIRRELQQTPEIALDLVREALELAAGSQQLKIRLNPADYDVLAPGVAELARFQGDGVTAELSADASVSPGGCVVQTEFGTIDQRLESQLARILEELS